MRSFLIPAGIGLICLTGLMGLIYAVWPLANTLRATVAKSESVLEPRHISLNRPITYYTRKIPDALLAEATAHHGPDTYVSVHDIWSGERLDTALRGFENIEDLKAFPYLEAWDLDDADSLSDAADHQFRLEPSWMTDAGGQAQRFMIVLINLPKLRQRPWKCQPRILESFIIYLNDVSEIGAATNTTRVSDCIRKDAIPSSG